MKNWNKLKKENACEIYQHHLAYSFLDKICEIMDEKNINQKELAKKMGLSQSQISRLLGGDGNFTIKTLAKLFFALDEEIKILTKSEYKKDNKISSYFGTLESSIIKTDKFGKRKQPPFSKNIPYPNPNEMEKDIITAVTIENRELKYGT